MSKRAKENRKIKKENQRCYPMAYADWKPSYNENDYSPAIEMTASELDEAVRMYGVAREVMIQYRKMGLKNAK